MPLGAKVCDLTEDLLLFVCGLYVGILMSSLNTALEATLPGPYSGPWAVFRASDYCLCVSYISLLGYGTGADPGVPPFWGTPKLHKEGKKTSCPCAQKRRVLLLNS